MVIKINEKIINLISSLKKNYNLSAELISSLEDISKNVNIIDNKDRLIQIITDMIINTKHSFSLYIPVAIPEVLQVVSEIAYNRKKVSFLIVCNWDLLAYADIIRKMKMLGNINFRNINDSFNYCLCSRDSSEFLLGKFNEIQGDFILIQYRDIKNFKVFNEIILYFYNLSKHIGEDKLREAKHKAKMAKKLAKKEKKEEKKKKKMYK